MAALCWARFLVALLPFRWWRGSLGWKAPAAHSSPDLVRARRSAAHVEWAAEKLPFATKCLPRAMALSWILRSAAIDHCVVLAVRPPELRGAEDELHAWVEVAGERVLGDLLGLWIEMIRLGGNSGNKINEE